MITPIKFKCLVHGKIKNIIIPIEHEITSPHYNGVIWESVESQVIDYLDGIDKRDIMIKYDIDVIIDYYPYIKKEKKNEIEEFYKFCKDIGLDEGTILRIGSVADSMKKELFGKGLSNHRKAEIILSALKFGMDFTSKVLDKVFEEISDGTNADQMKQLEYN